MKKPIKLMGTALFAAALSFAVSSCEKVQSSVSEESEADVAEQTVDFSEITKATEEVLSDSQENTQDAISDIVKSLAKQLGKAGSAVESAINDFQTDLFDLFTYYGDRHDFDFQVESKKFFKYLFEFTVNNKFVSDPSTNYVSVSCKDKVLELRTKQGSFIKVYLPSWIASVYEDEKGGKLDFTTDLFKDCVYAVEIGKGDVVYAKKVLNTMDETATLSIYDLNDNTKEVARSTVDYSKPFDVVTSVWYNNAEVREPGSIVAGTNIQARDLDELFCTLSEIKDTYSYAERDARSIVNDFNANVLAYNEQCTLPYPVVHSKTLTYPELATPALLEGKPLCAAYFTEARTQLCRVVVMHGDKVVTTGSVLEFVRYLLGEKKKDQNLSFKPESEGYTAYVDKDFEEPVLTGAKTYVTYTSSDTTVAAVEPYTGEVKALKAGKCIITATAAKSVLYNEKSVSYILIVEEDLAVLLPGEFSVSDSKKVKFTRGNLYWDGEDFHIEKVQTAFPTSRGSSHVGHFYWSQTASVAYAEKYSDESKTATDALFCGIENKIKVDGHSNLYALTKEEWQYLFARTDAEGNKLYKVSVQVDTVKNCLVVAPDSCLEGYNFDNSKTSYTAEEWAAAESAGLLCLPSYGRYTYGYSWYQLSDGIYWCATPDSEKTACYCSFNSNGISNGTMHRSNSCFIRLVSTVPTDSE